MTINELYNALLRIDESVQIEAKRGSLVGKSVLETICAFSNEPGIVEGYILLGVSEQKDANTYRIDGVEDVDKLQKDLSTQCATLFNIPIRPQLHIEEIEGKKVVMIHVHELSPAQKPLYFKAQGLPRGAYRRVGSTDQRCGEEDLSLFYSQNDSYESSVLYDTDMTDVDMVAIERYRFLRSKVNPMAEELLYKDEELLMALGCAKRIDGVTRLTNAGLIVFGNALAHRRLIPAVRVDYIRVPGNEWMDDPQNRFITIDMRGALLLIVSRLYNAVAADLPNGFMLEEGELQARSVGLPGKVLREALVNALIHRSYRVHQPIQVIRYDDRIEIKNPGYSLKPIDLFMQPGSELRNPFISSVFHETNLAETKGSGISTIHRLMEEASLEQPNFDSSRESNTFTTTILLKSIDPETSDILAKMLTLEADAKTTAKTTAKLATKSTQNVLAEILQKPEITLDELSVKCNLSVDGIRYHLRKLRERKTIVRVGGTNGGYWKVYNVK